MSMSCLDCHDYMDGYNRGKREGVIEELNKIKAKINLEDVNCRYDEFAYSSGLQKAIELIDKHIEELKGDDSLSLK